MRKEFFLIALLLGSNIIGCTSGPRDVKQALLDIVKIDKDWDYKSLARYVYGFKLSDKFDTKESIMRGIMGHVATGAFAYSETSFTALASEANYLQFRAPTTEELKDMFLSGAKLGKDPLLMKIAESSSKDSIRVFRKKADTGLETVIVFVQIEGEWKLVFSQDATLIN